MSIFQAKGQRYEYGDFILKFGQVSAGPSFKGIVIEVKQPTCVIIIDNSMLQNAPVITYDIKRIGLSL